MSQATIDNVTIALISWQPDPGDSALWLAEIRVSSASDRAAGFVPSLVSLTAVSAAGVSTTLVPEESSTLPCSVNPGEQAVIHLSFRLEPGQIGLNLTIGMQEEGRSGANVVFPLDGGGASATGGSGAAGADARGGNAIGGDVSTPGVIGISATPPHAASPSAGTCAH